ncbi:MAG TPA: beta-galactosidase [Terriglobia bacterium]|nr:beta-galactosidase [Terriglobia bacterium]
MRRTRALVSSLVMALASAAALIVVPVMASSSPRTSQRSPSRNTKTEARSPASGFFPMAVWYGGGKARAPMLERLDKTSAERWGRDLDQIKAVGFNTVKCWVDWATAEPKPGEFHFENLDLLLRLAQARGLSVIVQIYLDSAPDWVGRRYPDGRFVDRSGAVIDSEAAPGFCIDHQGVRAEIVKFLEALSRDANRSTALYGWDVWSEPHVINWAEFPYLTHPEFCFCPSSQARFRKWLEGRYKTIDALNAAWYRRFDRWDEVSPPRASTILSYTDYLDWRMFIADKLAGDLKTRVDAIRSADPSHPVTSHAAVPGLFTSPTDGYGEPDDWKMSASADFFGTSLYPKHSESTRPWPYPQLAAALDFTRSAGHSYGKGFWIGELQAGQGVTGMRIADPVDSHDEQFWMWQALAHGAREIAIYAWYPMSSGYESGGYGLINLDGTLTDRARAGGEVAGIVEKYAADFLAAKPAPASVGILSNRLSSMVGGAEPSLSRLGNAERDSLMGLHRAFFERQIPVDFVDPGDVTRGRLTQYKILFLPYPVMLSRDVAQGVMRFVKGGGTAVAEARLAWNDERGDASDIVPGAGLDEVFGAREKMIRPFDKLHLFIEPSPELPGFAPREVISTTAFEEDLEPSPGAHVLARFSDGAAGVVANTYGRGKAILIGSFPALGYQREHEGSTRRLLVALAESAGVTPEVEVSGSGAQDLEVRRLVSDRVELLFVFNHSTTTAADATIALRLPWPRAEARDVVTGNPVELEQPEGKTTLRRKLAVGEILVVRFERH